MEGLVSLSLLGMDGHLLQQRLDSEQKWEILSRQTNDLSQRMKDLEIEDRLCEIERELRELDHKAGVWLLLGCEREVVGWRHLACFLPDLGRQDTGRHGPLHEAAR